MEEQACQYLKQGEAEDMQAEVKAVLKKAHSPRLTSSRKNKRL